MFEEILCKTALPLGLIGVFVVSVYIASRTLAKFGLTHASFFADPKDLRTLVNTRKMSQRYWVQGYAIMIGYFAVLQLICSCVAEEYVRPSWWLVIIGGLVVDAIQWRLWPPDLTAPITDEDLQVHS
jgi:hypothetical protein